MARVYRSFSALSRQGSRRAGTRNQKESTRNIDESLQLSPTSHHPPTLLSPPTHDPPDPTIQNPISQPIVLSVQGTGIAQGWDAEVPATNQGAQDLAIWRPPAARSPRSPAPSFLSNASDFHMGALQYIDAPNARHVTLRGAETQLVKVDGMSDSMTQRKHH